MTEFKIDKKSELQFDYDRENECLHFAAAELFRYISAMFKKSKSEDCDAPLREQASFFSGEGEKTRSFVLGCGEEFCRREGVDASRLCWDGYAISAREDRLVLASLKERGVLFAVYEFLSAGGCRFIKAARVGERIPQTESLSFAGTWYFNPSFEIRSLATAIYEDTEEWKEETIAFVDWCAKNRINTIFLHQSVQQPLAGKNGEVQKEIARRDLRLEFGGHSAELYIPRELFEARPERFVFKDGKRRPQGNFCCTNRENLADIKKSIINYLRENPGIEVLHVWFEDVIEGSWCECKDCRGMNGTQQQMHVLNEVAKGIAEEFPGLKVDMLLYHDTLEEIERIERPEANVVALFAARERCMGHSFGDQGCALNAALCERLDKTIAKFGAENVCAFNYYLDYILFSKTKVLLPRIIAEDMAYYRKKGLRQVCALSFGLYSYWAYDLNFYVYAKHAFFADADIEETIAAYCADFCFPAGFRDYIDRMEDFSREYFAFCGYSATWYLDIRFLGLCEYFGEHIERIKKAVVSLRAAEELLGELAKKSPKELEDYFRFEKVLLQLTRMEADGILKRMSIRFKNYRENPKDKTPLKEGLESIKPALYKMIDIMEKIPEDVKGVQGGTVFREQLCKDQIWTLNELQYKEFHLDVDLDRSMI